MKQEKDYVLPAETAAEEADREDLDNSFENEIQADAEGESPDEAGDEDNASSESEKPETDSEDADADRAAERRERMEACFGEYPKTMETLSRHSGFEITAGIERFMASVSGFMRGSGKKPGEMDEALSMLFSIGMGVSEGEPTLDMLDTIAKGVGHERMLAEQTRAAEIKGRNARIEAKMRERTAGDGVPHPATRNTSGKPRSRGIFSLAAEAKR